ncbi:hypothetical protein U9M48_028917 [Paspalum notatum var. saurae]|uniref:Reverse transcriptase n=1 Tax=Paspalum notatum var. saurae TaxID=547442 RepID=A0AAQ3U227_PASNO
MNPDIKFLLDEMTKRLDGHDAKLDRRLSDLDSKLDQRFVDCDAHLDQRLSDLDSKWERQLEEFSTAHDKRVSRIESVAASLEDWRPEVEGMVDDVRLHVIKLSKLCERAAVEHPINMTGVLAPAPSPAVAAHPPAGNTATRPNGHCDDSSHRDDGFGGVKPPNHHPVMGAYPPPLPFPQFMSSGTRGNFGGDVCSGRGKLPKLHFPQFDGSQPKLWLSRCEDYFELYGVDSHMWVKVASLHFSASAARWLQSVEQRVRHCSWAEFRTMIMDRFGRDQHELLLRQLFNIRQTGTVAEYIDQFAGLIDQLIAYGHQNDPLYYATRFVDGLADDIKPAVLLQRASTWDTACVLAQLQEEVVVARKRSVPRRPDAYMPPRAVPAGPMPLPLPPQRDKPVDLRQADPSRAKSAEDRWSALRAYRRACGLCIKCAEPWTKEHRCSAAVQLNALQEVLELFHIEDDPGGEDTSQDHSPTHLFLAVSVAAVTGGSSPRSMCFDGFLQDQAVRILLDSGSSHSFLSAALVPQLVGVAPLARSLSVQVANGSVLECSFSLPSAQWVVQDVTFLTDLKVLPLSSYDMILGMDWLEAFSPMKIHWKDKWISFFYNGNTIILQGKGCVLPMGTVVQIQQLIDEFPSLFEVPSSLPPTRSCDHSIPLITSASPVAVRPYRYAPVLKNEIEKQITEMLASGIIQPSASPFSSSVLLVKKKDNTWRFCVDYRHLNAITVKGKYPVPVIDELLDELSGEEYKTAFQTHCGQFEFRVMAFGLTGAPGTFRLAMNTTLAPCLRHFALVFFDDILIYSPTFEDHLSHLRQVFELLDRDQWKVKMSKCSFALRQIGYLGHVISAQGVSTDPDKVSAIASWSSPTSAKELRSFLGLAGYYRKFVPHFGILSKPLHALLKKHAIFVWTSEQEHSFRALKYALCHTPVLALPNFDLPFAIETDACATGIGAVLLQQGHPLAYFSKALGPKSQGLSTYEKEYLAILMAVQQWRSYLQLREFIIFTDQRSLVQLTDQRLHTHWQQKVFSKLLGFQYKVVYKKGADNRVADALSRKTSHEGQCAAISVCSPQWIQEVISSYESDDTATSLIAKLSIDPTAVPHFTLEGGILRYKNRIWVGPDASLRLKLLSACHASAIGGHSGFPVTYLRMKRLFAWRGMKTEVVSLDFIEGLPLSSGYNCVLVVIDFFTKYGHFIPLRHPFTAVGVAKAFFHEALYGYSPRHFGVVPADAVSSPTLEDWCRDRELIQALIKQHLARSRLRMKRQADQHRSEREFAVGDAVFLKLQPYVQASLAPRSNQKLAYKFFGPFTITDRVGKVAYKLALPASSSIHPVFHVSQLKAAAPSHVSVSPSVPDDIDIPRFPEIVLQRRVFTRGLRPRHQVLIQWSNWPASLATWDDEVSLRQAFPFAPAWGQASAQQGGNVTHFSDQENLVGGPRRSTRTRKPSTLVSGDEWCK